MRLRSHATHLAVCTLAAVTAVSALAGAIKVGTAFTFQGRLNDATGKANGPHDFEFGLFDDSGTQVGVSVTKDDVVLEDGLFTVVLDFGPNAFDGKSRSLEVRVRRGDEVGAYTTLLPRQLLTAAPYAQALPGLRTPAGAEGPNVIGGHGENHALDGVTGATISGGGRTTNSNLITDHYGTIGGGRANTAGDGAGALDNADFATVSGGIENGARARGASVGGGQSNEALTSFTTIGGGFDNGTFSSYGTIGGGSQNGVGDQFGTVSGGNQNMAGDFTPLDASLATVGGGSGNRAAGRGATIGGGLGGSVTGDYGTIGGGGRYSLADATTGNRVTDLFGTVSGGADNQAGDTVDPNDPRNDAWAATVGGGAGNEARATGSIVAGGFFNIASGIDSSIGGGSNNDSSGSIATIGGGFNNAAAGLYATISGGHQNEANSQNASVGGGEDNKAEGLSSTVAGGFDNVAITGYATIGGGGSNSASGSGATIAGGGTNTTTDNYGTIGGGSNNQAGDSLDPNDPKDDAPYATVGGGYQNLAGAFYATVSGGVQNEASGGPSTVAGGFDNQATAGYSAIGGGGSNVASGGSSVIAGGGTNKAERFHATIGGGYGNRVSAQFGTIAGGGTSSYPDVATANRVTDDYGTVAGGGNNQAGDAVDGNDPTTDRPYAAVGGGFGNTAGGAYSVVPGGYLSSALEDYSFAAGRVAQALHAGAFVWADSTTDVPFPSVTPNEFAIRAAGGLRLSEDAGTDTTMEIGRRFRDNGIVAWARVTSTGGMGTARLGVSSVAHVLNSGDYLVTVDVSAAASSSLIPMAVPDILNQPTNAAALRIVSVHQTAVNQFHVYMNNGSGAAVDNQFLFMVTAR